MEWKIIKDTVENAQRKLNQWRHMYYIHIHGIDFDEKSNKIIILLTREDKR
jgi:hypothetical protein